MTKLKQLAFVTAVISACALFPIEASAQYVVENLGRGVIAIRASESTVYVRWRLLGTDPSDVAFNVYRASGSGAPVKLNQTPLVATTNLVDTAADLTQATTYTVRPVLQGTELAASTPFVLPAGAPIRQYLTVPLDRPAGGNVEVPAGSPTSAFTYSPNDASAADLDGDGEYEIILKWDPSNSRDNASAGLSGRQLIDAYKIDGTRLWRIDLGRTSGPARITRSSWSTTSTATAAPKWRARGQTARRWGRHGDWRRDQGLHRSAIAWLRILGSLVGWPRRRPGTAPCDAPSSVNHAVWWDADLLREIEDSNWISKWDWNTSSLVRLLTATDAASNNGTKANASLTADLFGDWREEVIWRSSDNTSLRIYSTTVPASNRIYTLMHDPQYRLGIAWQNVAYNQPPHPSFFLGEGMADPPRPRIVHRDTQPPAFKTLTASATTLWPPNHRMVPVSQEAALVDLLDPAPTARIVGVSSNEPIDGADDGNTSPDWEITGALRVNLRAERSETGTGRIYMIQVEGRDTAGNTTLQTVSVSVPVEQ